MTGKFEQHKASNEQMKQHLIEERDLLQGKLAELSIQFTSLEQEKERLSKHLLGISVV